jgi:hypothetical protein
MAGGLGNVPTRHLSAVRGVAMSEQDPADLVASLAEAYVNSRCLHVIAYLGVCDAVADVPLRVTDIAGEVGADAVALGRVMRHLASLGIFEMRDGAFRHNEASRLLTSDHPSGLLPLTRLLGLPIVWDSFKVLEDSVRSGRPGADFHDPDGFFAYLEEHPGESNTYDEGMTAMTLRRIERIVPHYDFSRFASIADIGGGRGHLLRAVLDQAPSAAGILFDRPQVLAAFDGDDRIALQPGDFFTDPLPAAACYLLSNIVHDWGDDEAVAILSALRAAALRDSALLLFEFVVPVDAEPFEATDIDVFMLALVSGRERTLNEYEQLLAAAGWALVAAVPTPSQTILVARPN